MLPIDNKRIRRLRAALTAAEAAGGVHWATMGITNLREKALVRSEEAVTKE
jgi:hypothetical protein